MPDRRSSTLEKPTTRSAVIREAKALARSFSGFFNSPTTNTRLKPVQFVLNESLEGELGLALPSENRIELNARYFLRHPERLPHTVFHELTHLWLYALGQDPGHNELFYGKLSEYRAAGFPIDPMVHIHESREPVAKYIYECPNCECRWFFKEKIRSSRYCGPCYEKENRGYRPQLQRAA